MKRSVLGLLVLFSASLYALEDIDRQQIQQRIQPVGKVRVEEQNGGAAQGAVVNKAVTQTEAKKEPGQETYEQYCVVCHRDGLAGAPKFRDANDWKPRLAGKTIDEILAIAIQGLNAMPPKGTCATCSDAELKAAIEYMLPKS